jgi:hypothetical protein
VWQLKLTDAGDDHRRDRDTTGIASASGKIITSRPAMWFLHTGLIVASKAVLDQNPNPSEKEVRHWLAGNLCRCTGYDRIVRAVLDAAQVQEKTL